MEIENLVTSPHGIGERLIIELLKRGETVYTVFPSPKDVPMSFLGKLNLKYGFVKFDQEQNIEKGLPKKAKNLFHVYDVYTGHFPKIFTANAMTTLLLLDWARKVGVSKFIYLSSGEVYGQGKDLNEASAYNPRTFYAVTKFQSEILFKFYHKSFEIKNIRLFFPYGKNVNHGYIFNLVQAVKSGDSIETEFGTIAPTFVDDVIESLIKIREIDGNCIFNICGSPIKVENLVKEIEKISNKSAKKISVGKNELSGNSSKARESIGYKETPFEEAIKNSFA